MKTLLENIIKLSFWIYLPLFLTVWLIVKKVILPAEIEEQIKYWLYNSAFIMIMTWIVLGIIMLLFPF